LVSESQVSPDLMATASRPGAVPSAGAVSRSARVQKRQDDARRDQFDRDQDHAGDDQTVSMRVRADDDQRQPCKQRNASQGAEATCTREVPKARVWGRIAHEDHRSPHQPHHERNNNDYGEDCGGAAVGRESRPYEGNDQAKADRHAGAE
jgi:hypothetical protein